MADQDQLDGEGGNLDGGAGGGNDDGTKFVVPKDGSWIPKARFDDAINTEKARITRLEAELAALRVAQPKSNTDEAPKRFSRTELNAAVKAEQITQDQADEILDKQIREDAATDAEKRILGRLRQEQGLERVGADLTEYKRLSPEILDSNSEVRQRIADEYQYLKSIGNADGLATELMAVRAVLGPLDKLKLAKSSRRDDEGHQEGGGQQGGGSRKAGKTAVDGLSTREKDYYDSMIKKGRYKDWKEVEAELKFSNPDVRRKAAARA